MTVTRRPLRAFRPLALSMALVLAVVAGAAGPSAPHALAATAPAPLTSAQFAHRLSRDVYGYLPYWELDSTTDAYLRYDLLTTISLFSFRYGSDGTITKPSQYALLTGSTAQTIIAHAHAAGVRVELAFSFSSTTSVNDAFFNDAAAQATAIAQTIALLKQLGADGVNLDVELLSNANFPLYGAFVKAMKAAVVKANPSGQVSVATNGNASGAWLAVQALGNGADRDFIMGYDFRTGGANPVGSISPLVSFNGGPNLTDTLDIYATRGVPMGRVLLGLPYYGRTWPTVSNAMHAAQNTSLVLPSGVTACSWNASYPYFFPAAIGKVPAGSTFGYDDVEQAAWFATYDATAKTWCETYYDSPRSLSAKYGLAVSHGLAGVGMWALGYDQGQTGYWAVLEAEFATTRLGGADRYAVAAAVSAATFPSGAPVAYLANGYAYADALAGSVAATKAGGPILLVSAAGVPSATAKELARLKPTKLVLLGGPASLPDAVGKAAQTIVLDALSTY
jgi:spore germination protein YaaH